MIFFNASKYYSLSCRVIFYNFSKILTFLTKIEERIFFNEKTGLGTQYWQYYFINFLKHFSEPFIKPEEIMLCKGIFRQGSGGGGGGGGGLA